MDRRSESILIAVVTKCGWITYSHDVDRTDATMSTLIASTVIMVPVFFLKLWLGVSLRDKVLSLSTRKCMCFAMVIYGDITRKTNARGRARGRLVA
jgi:hypothetical protein